MLYMCIGVLLFFIIYIYIRLKNKSMDMEKQVHNLKKENEQIKCRLNNIERSAVLIREDIDKFIINMKKIEESESEENKEIFYKYIEEMICDIVKEDVEKYFDDYGKKAIEKEQNILKEIQQIKNDINKEENKKADKNAAVLNVNDAFDLGVENIRNSAEDEKLEDSSLIEENNLCKTNDNKTMMQFFEWYYPNDGSLWKKVKEESEHLKTLGITSLWLPPAYKAHNGINDVGYSTYDLYDLGEFDQKGTIRTKYGTKDEYIEGIKEAHKNGIKVYGDVVFNHKAGADGTEFVIARQVDENNRNMFIGEEKEIEAHTIFSFPGRKEKYSAYKWTANDFDGVDYDEISKKSGIFKFKGKEWEQDVDKENGNYDFLMFADLDMDSPYVVEELKRWGKWYIRETHIDGFRLDAIKHIRFDFFKEWLSEMRKSSSKDLFAVGEYWTWDVGRLRYYLDRCGHSMKLFDAPLHYNFQAASNSWGNYDMSRIKDNTLLQVEPEYTVTFVDNHDTQIGQSLESWVKPWFKPLAYTFILTRDEGYPCIFYGDYYGIPEKGYEGIKDSLDIIIKARKEYAYGIQHDYLNDKAVIGWTREGDDEHKNSGLAALITVAVGGKKKMYVGKNHIGESWIDITGQDNNEVVIDKNGMGEFSVKDGSYSIWIKNITI